jgi:DNA replication licensing factor MCM3
MKKYIHMAKMIQPVLTQKACEVIADEYAKLRSQDALENEESNVTPFNGGPSKMARTQPVTARALETLIRLATAHAKARMSRKIDEQDADAAIKLVQFAYFKRVLEKEPKRRRRDSGQGSDEEAAGSDVEDPVAETGETEMDGDGSAPASQASAASTEAARKKRRVRSPGSAQVDTTATIPVPSGSAASAPVAVSAER